MSSCPHLQNGQLICFVKAVELLRVTVDKIGGRCYNINKPIESDGETDSVKSQQPKNSFQLGAKFRDASRKMGRQKAVRRVLSHGQDVF